jgi:RNA polymerase sigma-70 factor (ECF subfamily)
MPDAHAWTVPQPDATPPTASEDALDARSAASGDSRALARLYERHAPMVHAIALVRVDRSDAEDVTHDVFVKAMKSITLLKDGQALAPWLAQIARNTAIDHARSRNRWRWFASTGARRESIPSAARATCTPDADDILRAIRSLPEAYRESLVLRLVEQMTGPQIAAALDMTHGSVRVNLHRGMELLRAQLARPNTGGRA